MPRAFSSGRRSVSVPVSALTSEVLPWSMWPAVPTTTWRRAALIRARRSWRGGGDDRLHELRDLRRQHRPAVEEQPVLDEPAHDGRVAGP